MLTDKIARAEEVISQCFNDHENIVLGFSGGKESLVLLDMVRPYQDRIKIYWVNTGGMLPHMEEFIKTSANGFNLVELSSNQESFFKSYGIPVEIPCSNA